MAMGLLVVFGTLTGAITAMQEVFGTDDRWWLIYLFEIVVIIVVLPIFPFLYESPM
jgi:cytochrome c biogenesis protein CcdA